MNYSTSTRIDAGNVLALVFGIGFLAGLILLVLFIWGMIFKRAGYSFAMALLMFLPLVNVIWLMIFAFSRWPIQKELDYHRAQAAYRPVRGAFPVGPVRQG
jgi:fatty acid desaturase